MKLIVKSGTSSVEYIEADRDNSYPLLTYNTGTNGTYKFDMGDQIIKTITEMCHLCKEMEDSKYK